MSRSDGEEMVRSKPVAWFFSRGRSVGLLQGADPWGRSVGLLQGADPWGRPVGLLQGADPYIIKWLTHFHM